MKNPISLKQIAGLTAATLCASFVSAQTLLASTDDPDEENPGVEITRSASDLSDMVAIRPIDRDFINTALVLTDAGGRDSVAYCVAYDQRGNPVGRGYTRIPGNGVRLVLASDLTHGVDFFGKIRCKSRDRISGTAYIIGPDFSDTRVHNFHDRVGSLINVPVAISR